MTSPQPQARDEVERLVERLNAAAKSFDRPPSIQSQSNVRAIDAMHEAASTLTAQARGLEVMRAALRRARAAITNENGLNGGSVVCTVWADTITTVVDDIDAALNSGGAE